MEFMMMAADSHPPKVERRMSSDPKNPMIQIIDGPARTYRGKDFEEHLLSGVLRILGVPEHGEAMGINSDSPGLQKGFESVDDSAHGSPFWNHCKLGDTEAQVFQKIRFRDPPALHR
jgi:hypothetical protein